MFSDIRFILVAKTGCKFIHAGKDWEQNFVIELFCVVIEWCKWRLQALEADQTSKQCFTQPYGKQRNLRAERAKSVSTKVVSRAGLFGSGSGPKLTKMSSLIRAWDVLFVLGAQKYNQNNLATLLNFSDLT